MQRKLFSFVVGWSHVQYFHIFAQRMLATLNVGSWFVCAYAGLEPVRHVPGVENVNLSRLVNSHSSYPELMPEILDLLGLAEEKAFE